MFGGISVLINKKSVISVIGALTICSTLATTVSAASALKSTSFTAVTGAVSTIRLAGVDRVKTSVNVADTGWSQSDYAIIADAWDFPDAVSAAPLAYKYKAPILLTDTANLSADTEAELTKLQVKHVFIVGGTGAVSANVESKIIADGMDVQRLSGNDRYATSIAIANAVGNSGSIVITNGYNPFEALSISSIAAKEGMPIILTARDSVPAEVSSYLAQNSITKTYVLGKADGTTSDDGVADSSTFPNPTRITGSSIYERNINILKEFSGSLNFSTVYFATGKSFADALAGSALAATTSSPIIFIDADMPKVTSDFISSETSTIASVYVLGGKGAVSDETVNNAEKLITAGNTPSTTPTAATVDNIDQQIDTAVTSATSNTDPEGN